MAKYRIVKGTQGTFHVQRRVFFMWCFLNSAMSPFAHPEFHSLREAVDYLKEQEGCGTVVWESP